MNGIVPRQKQAAPVLAPKMCVRCESRNSPASKFCNKCGSVLDSATARMIDENRKEVERLLDRLAEDPEKDRRLLRLVS
jgi:predicted amidophosphoribosyltransferase